MGRIRVSRRSWARLGVLVGGGMVAAGVGFGIDLAAALMVGGMELVAYCLLVADVGGDDT
ncbi:hypothetical protein J3A78_003867 [Streptomyces sp. PvR006]|uniref:hypothetical protein n=1 Tax=Streptomyces sp. PvR006 TaxID=2817860 RepID=UPI001AE4B8EC|nr:hypothetical protein [Streptomyces sp. PvR006]MBP2583389.1 hypothetical protein [Streptomyces sp. PvR006]